LAHTREQKLIVVDKRRAIGGGLEPYSWEAGPLYFKHIRVTLYGHIDSEFNIERGADILFVARASAAEAIRHLITRNGWLLEYSIEESGWRAGKVQCCIEIPTKFMDKFQEICSVVDKDSESDGIDGHSEFVILPDEGDEEIGEVEDDEESGEVEGDEEVEETGEGEEALPLLERWDD